MKNSGKDDDEVKHRVLITVDSGRGGSLQSLANHLESMGLGAVEAFELGGVIAGEASRFCLSEIRKLPDVLSIEEDDSFAAL